MSVGIKNIGDFFKSLSAYGQSTGSPLTVVLDTGAYGARANVEVWVKSSGVAAFTISGSKDGTQYRVTDTISLAAAGEEHRGYGNAYRYIKVETTAPNDNEIEIISSR